MKYNGKDIGIPTFEQFKKIVFKTCGKRFSAEKMYKTLVDRKWKTRQGEPISDLERTLKGMCGNNIRKWGYFTNEIQAEIKELRRRQRESKIKPTITKVASNQSTPYLSYNEQLKDSKWQAFRDFVFVVLFCKCEMCGINMRLQVTHLKYRIGV